MTSQARLEEMRAKVRLSMLGHPELVREQLPDGGPYEPNALNTGLAVTVGARAGHAIVKVAHNGPCVVVSYRDDNLPRSDQVHCVGFEPTLPGVISLSRISGAPVALDMQGATEAALLLVMLQIAEQAS